MRPRNPLILLVLAVALSGCTTGGTASDGSGQDEALPGEIPAGDSAEVDSTADGATGENSTDEATPAVVPPGRFEPLGEPGVGGQGTSIAFDPSSPTGMLVGGDMLGIARAEDPTIGWLPTTGLLSWEVAEFSFDPADPSVVWVGTMGGPYVSEDGGQVWRPARVGMPPVDPEAYSAPIEVIRFDPATPDRLLAFGGSQRRWQRGFDQGDPAYGAIWESLDAGASWTLLSTVGDGASVQAGVINVDGSLVYAAALNRGLFVSSDGGGTWSRSASGLPHGNVTDVAVHPTDPASAWIALGQLRVDGTMQPGGIYRTTDGGQSWEAAMDGLVNVTTDSGVSTATYERIVVAPSDPERLYTSNVARGQVAVYRSVDGGSSWSVIADAETERPRVYQSSTRANEIAVHPTDADTVAFSQDDYILGSTDGGETWSDLTSAATGEGSFTGRGYSGLVASDIAFDPASAGSLAIGAFDGGNFIGSTDGGGSWLRPITDPEFNWGGAEEIRYATSDRVYVLLGQSTANFRGVGVSDDGGRSFTVRHGDSAGLPPTRTDLDPTGLTVDPTDPETVLIVLDGVVYRSTDGAQSFQIVASGATDAHDVEFSPDGRLLYISTGVGVFSSSDGGDTVVYVDGSPFGTTRLTVDPSQPSWFYVSQYRAEEGGLQRFDGSGFSRILDDPQVHEVAVQPGSASTLVAVATDQPRRDDSLAEGVYVSVDGGSTWAIYNQGLPMTRVATVEFDPFDPDRLIVGTTGRGFYEASLEALLRN